MKFIRFIPFFLFAILGCALQAHENEHMNISSEGSSPAISSLDERVYFSLSQLCLEDEGMYVDLQGKVLPIEALYRDDRGYYIVIKNRGERWECENGHPARNGDGRCNQAGCPYSRRPDWVASDS